MKYPGIIVAMMILLLSCNSNKKEPQSKESNRAQAIIDQAIQVHSGDKFIGRKIEFDFRKKHYSSIRSNDKFTYTRSYKDDSLGFVQDTLINSSTHVQYRDGELVELNEEWHGRYSNSVNSVMYFTQLPYGLNDPAVIKSYLGEVSMKGQPYHKIQVTFERKGGGDDFDDVYVYWIHKKNLTLDYLAYEFHVDNGGIRFREAINRREIGGITFQDYINFKPKSKDASVHQTDSLFEAGALEELSRIINENVNVRPVN